MRFTSIAVIAVALVATAAIIDTENSDSEKYAYGAPGDAVAPPRIVDMAIREADDTMHFVPNRIFIRTGEQIQFALRNQGEGDHEFVLGTSRELRAHAKEMRKTPRMEHDGFHSRRLRTDDPGHLVWRFTRPGTFEFACMVPGHRESGLIGTIVVAG